MSNEFFENNPETLDEIKRFIEVKNQIDKLEKEKKELSDKIKQLMEQENLKKIQIDDYSLALSQYEHHIVPACRKNKFIAEMAAKDRGHLILHSLEPNVKEIIKELHQGDLTLNFVERFIVTCDVTSLRCIKNE